MELTLTLHSTKDLKNLESILYGQAYSKFNDLKLIVFEFESKKKYTFEIINLGNGYIVKDQDYYVFSCTEEEDMFN